MNPQYPNDLSSHSANGGNAVFGNALMLDAAGRRSTRFLVAQSQDWDEVRSLVERLYTPCRLSMEGRAPATSVYSTRFGAFTLSRLSLGVAVAASADAGSSKNGMVLTLLKGRNAYRAASDGTIELHAGESLIADIAATHLEASISEDTQSLNLSFLHDHLAEFHEQWYGHAAPARMWRHVIKLDTGAASLLPLLDYASRCAVERQQQVEHGRLGRHLEELMAMHLLAAWRDRAQVRALPPSADTGCVQRACDFIAAHLRSVPTRAEIARAAGVSVRTLSQAFLRVHGTSPMAYQRDLRLRGVRDDLQRAQPGCTVTQVALAWGFGHLGQFAIQYKQRFGEMPSETLRRSRP